MILPVTMQIFWTLVKYGLGLSILAWVIWSYWDPEGEPPTSFGLKDALQGQIHILPLVLAVVLCVGSLCLSFFRWFLLVRAQNLPFTLFEAVRLGLIGFSLSTFLPGSIGGDVIKAAFLARSQSKRTIAVSTVILDRVLGLCGLFWLAGLLGAIFMVAGYITNPMLNYILYFAWGVAGANLVFWFFLGLLPKSKAEAFGDWLQNKIPKMGGALAEMWQAGLIYRSRGKIILIAMFMAMIGHIGFVLTFYFASLTLSLPADLGGGGPRPSLIAHFLIVPVGLTIQAGVPLPGGIGVAELGFGALYELAGSLKGLGICASLVQRVVFWFVGLVGYIVYLRMKPGLVLDSSTKNPEVDPEERVVLKPLAVAET